MKRFFVMAMTAIVVCSCEKGAADLLGMDGETEVSVTDTDEGAKKFKFTVKGDFLNPEFSDGTRANAYMTADGAEMTDLWVVDCKDGEIKQSLHQTQGDADWGVPVMSLSLGTHHVCFLASRGQGATYADGVVTWTKPMDSFYLDYEVVVAKTSNGNRAVTLNRVATKATVGIEDAIPAGTTIISLKPTTWYTGWNMLTGEPVAAPEGFCATISVPQSYEGHEGVSVSTWSLSGGEEWTSDITLVSKAGDVVNASATIAGAPFVANRATIYHGRLYSNDSESSVSLQSEWLTSYEGVY